MIEYVVPGNIDDRILKRGAKTLEEGGILALPTDTSWSLVCSLNSREGIQKLRRLSGERNERFFTLLCSDISQFGEFCSLDNSRFRLIKRLSPGPYVFILKTLLGTEKVLALKRKEVAVRIPGHNVPRELINTLGNALYSITAKRSMTEEGGGGPLNPEEAIPEDELFEGSWELENIDGVDCIFDPGEDLSRSNSTILDLTGDEIEVLRLGAGPWPV